MMTKQEGVIKFQLDYTSTDPLDASLLDDLRRWRDVLVEQRLIGQDPARYGGYGFGNISQRLPALESAQPENTDYTGRQPVFAISGTQTGHLPTLTPEHLAVVTACFPQENRIVARGPIQPSSESMTHAILYTLDANIQAVMHAHSPEIWQAAARLHLPTTAAHVEYGTPQMADAVTQLFATTDCAQRGIFSMAGHEDGIVTFGSTLDDAGARLLTALQAATA